jgi:hypothetical protein
LGAAGIRDENRPLGKQIAHRKNMPRTRQTNHKQGDQGEPGRYEINGRWVRPVLQAEFKEPRSIKINRWGFGAVLPAIMLGWAWHCFMHEWFWLPAKGRPLIIIGNPARVLAVALSVLAVSVHFHFWWKERDQWVPAGECKRWWKRGRDGLFAIACLLAWIGFAAGVPDP